MRIAAIGAILGLAILACGGQPSTPKPRTAPSTERAPTPPAPTPPATEEPKAEPGLANVPALAMKASKDVDAALGKPTSVAKIEGYPDQAPGEFRTYMKGANDFVQVRFFKGKAVSFAVSTTSKGSVEDALKLAGIDLAGRKPDLVAPGATRWKRVTIDGVVFDEIFAVGHTGDWTQINATTEHAFQGK